MMSEGSRGFTMMILAISLLSWTALAFGPMVPPPPLIQQVVTKSPASSKTMDDPTLLQESSSLSTLISTTFFLRSDDLGTIQSVPPRLSGDAFVPRGGGGDGAMDGVSPDALDKLLQLEKSGAVVLDPRTISSQNDVVMPGFKETRHVLPEGKNTDLIMGKYDSNESLTKVIMDTAFTTHVMLRLPLAAFFAALVDFFIVQRGIEVYREDLEENEGAVIKDTLTGGAIRLGVMAIIATATIWVTRTFG